MALNFNYLAPIILVLIGFFARDILCGDATIPAQRPVASNNPWTKIDTGPIDAPLFDPKASTPWPELGQKRPAPTTPKSRDFVSNPRPINALNPSKSNVQSQINFFENERNQQQNQPKRDYVAPNNQNSGSHAIGTNQKQEPANRDFVTPNNQNGGQQPKRDYVAPINPNIGRPNPPRDFVANNPINNAGQNLGGTSKPISANNQAPGAPPTPPPRRDFVANPKPNYVAPINPNIGRPNPPRDFVANNPINNAGQNLGGSSKPNAANNQAPGAPPTPPSRRDFVANPKPNAVQSPATPAKPGLNYAQAAQNNPNNGNNPTNTQKPGSNFAQAAQHNPNIGNNNNPTNTQKPGLNFAQAVQNKPNNEPINTKPAAGAAGVISPNAPNPSKIPFSAGPSKQPSTDTNNYQSKPDVNEDTELREFSEALVKKDVNNAAKYVTINYQGKTRSGSLNDEAPQPLLSIHADAYKIPSIEKLRLLYNNYILESIQNEVYTAQEKIEENNLLDTVLSTPVMQYTRNFLIQKGKLSKDPKDFRDLLKIIWFNMYSRGSGKIGSSGFEHVFLAEIKNDAISGLHNWIYFHDEENKKFANYLGYMKKLEFEKGAIIKYHFNFHNKDKPVGSMFIGTSPEFEMALYSTCFIMRPNTVCPLRLGGNNFVIRTFSYKYRGKNMIGSAFPEI